MAALPEPVLDHLLLTVSRRYRPAFLEVDAAGRIVRVGGSLGVYDASEAWVGEEAASVLPALGGLLPPSAEPLRLASVELRPGRHADVHVVAAESGAWVLLVDRTAEVAERRLAQQLANDVSLLRDHLARRAARSEGEEVPVLERTPCCVLAVALEGLGRECDRGPAAEARETAGLYLRAVARPVLDEAGVLAGVAGDRITAVFGAEAATAAPAALGVTAAMRALDAVGELNVARERDGLPALPARAAAVSGPVALGRVGGRSLGVRSALGDAFARVELLAAIAPEGGLAVDAETRAAAGDLERRFRPAEAAGPAAGAFVLARDARPSGLGARERTGASEGERGSRDDE